MINVERTAIRCLGVTTGCKITVANNSPGSTPRELSPNGPQNNASNSYSSFSRSCGRLIASRAI